MILLRFYSDSCLHHKFVDAGQAVINSRQELPYYIHSIMPFISE